MRKISLLLLLIVIIIQPSYTQNIKWGEEQKLSSRWSSVGSNFIEDDLGVYAATWQKGKLYFQKYDKDLNLSVEERIDKEYIDGNESVQGLGNNIFYFHSEYEPKTKKTSLFASEINKSTMKMTGKGTKITTVTARGKNKTGGFIFKKSLDNSKLLIVGQDAYKAKSKEKFNITVVEENMKKLWQKSIVMPYIDKLIAIESYHIDNFGNVFILAKKYKTIAQDKREGKKNFKYLLLAYQNSGSKVSETEIELDSEKYIVENAVAINKEGKIICTGFYSDTGVSSIKGAFVISLNPNTKGIETKSVKPFSESFVEMFRRGSKNKKKGELLNYNLDDIHFREDGGITIIGEQFYVTTSTYTDSNGRLRYQYIYHYDNLIVINVNKDVKIDWVKKVSKEQTGYESGYSAFVKKNDLYILFNDNPKNLNLPIDAKKVASLSSKKVTTVLVKFAFDGSAKKEVLFKNKDIGITTVPESCTQVATNEAIIYGERGKKYKLGRLTF